MAFFTASKKHMPTGGVLHVASGATSKLWLMTALNTPIVLIASLITATLVGCQSHHATIPTDPRPNIVLIIADDMSWDDCGPYGHPTIRTPNLDKLAAQGMRFDNAFLTISSCSPSRSSIITGRYPHNTDAEQLHWPLPKEQVTFVEKLKASGYFTAAAGKWHLGDAVKDRFDVIREASTKGFILQSNKGAGSKAGSMNAQQPSGCEDWVRTLKNRPRGKPFFLWLAALDPHRDYQPGAIPKPHKPHKPEDVRVPPTLPDTPEVRKDLALYYDEITRLDDYTGQVLAELERQGVADNTIVIFISDNGRPFPRDKTTVYDSGIKTPMFIRWPGMVKPGSVSKSVVSSVDLAPTIMNIAGLNALPTFEGHSFKKVLAHSDHTVRKYAFAEDNWHDYEDRSRMVRDERFKYIRNDYNDLPSTPPADAGRSITYQSMLKLRDAGQLTPAQMACFIQPRPKEELYDTQSDPHELKNLADDFKQAEQLVTMRNAMDDWQRRTNDVMPTKRTLDEFFRDTGAPAPPRIRPRPSKAAMQAKGLID